MLFIICRERDSNIYIIIIMVMVIIFMTVFIIIIIIHVPFLSLCFINNNLLKLLHNMIYTTRSMSENVHNWQFRGKNGLPQENKVT